MKKITSAGKRIFFFHFPRESAQMGKAKKTRKFAEVKRMLNPKDERIKALRGEQQKKKVNVYAADEHRAKHPFLCRTHSQIHARTPHTQHTHRP